MRSLYKKKGHIKNFKKINKTRSYSSRGAAYRQGHAFIWLKVVKKVSKELNYVLSFGEANFRQTFPFLLSGEFSFHFCSDYKVGSGAATGFHCVHIISCVTGEINTPVVMLS